MAKRPLIFRAINVDAVRIEQNKSSYQFFVDTPQQSQVIPVSSLPEEQAVGFILSHPSLKRIFLEELSEFQVIPSIYTSVKKPVVNWSNIPGDIDMMLTPKNQAEKTIAIECKRVKVIVDEHGEEKVNRLTGIEKGIQQANELRAKGFYKTYLMIIIVTDGRNIQNKNAFLRHGRGDELEVVYEIPMHEELDPKVGVIYFQITQALNKSINHAGSFGVCCDKEAEEQEQDHDLTNRIRQFQHMGG